MKSKAPGYHLKRNIELYMMMLPAILCFLIFNYWPMYGITIAFQKFNLVLGYFRSPWVGFRNFQSFLNDPYFFRLIRNTFLLALYSFLWSFPLTIIFALFLNEIQSKVFKRVVQSISYLPSFISTVVLISIVNLFISSPDGLINMVLNSLGRNSIEFMTQSKYFRTIFIASGIWQSLGGGSIIYLASMSAVDMELREAAIIDGANRMQNMWHITFAAIRPIVVVSMLLSMSGLLSVGFEKVYLMYNPQVYEVADVLATYTYRRGLLGMDYGYGAAIGFFTSVINLLLLVIFNTISRKISDESLW